MNDFQRSQNKMFDVVRKICRINYATLSAYVPFVPVFTEFESLLDEQSGWRLKQADRPKGITETKNTCRKVLETDAALLSASLYVCAKVNGLAELERRSKLTPTRLKMASEQELTGICHQLWQDAQANLALLAPWLIDALWLTAFEAKIEAFVALIGAPASARADIRKATEEVNRLVKAAAECLRLKLDPVMTYFELHDNTLYSTYRNARKLVSPATEKPALRGKVTDPEGKPLKGLQVTIAKTARKSITTALGNFRFKRLADGKYTLIVKEKKKEVARQEVTAPGEVEIVVNAVS